MLHAQLSLLPVSYLFSPLTMHLQLFTMIWSLFINWKLENLRIFAITIHLIMQGVLIWTKFDSIQVSMVDPADDLEYERYNQHYVTLLSFGIIFILWQLACFLINNPCVVTFGGVIHLVMDVFGIFFAVWIAMDGLAWTSYLLTWIFCIMLPAVYDMVDLLLCYSSQLWIRRNVSSWFQRLYMWWYGKKELSM